MKPLYRVLLRMYPGAFRARYAADILRALEDRRAAARAAGPVALVWFHVRAVVDLFVNAAGERLGRPGPAGSTAGRTRSAALSAFAQDARFGVRMLRRRPALAFFSAATLALGIAAVTTIVSLIDAVVLQPLPFPRPAEIVGLGGVIDGRPAGISYENLRDMKAQATGLRAVSPFFAQSVNLTGVPEPDRLRGGFVTSDFFDVIALPPALGRTFDRGADTPGSRRVAVLTDAAWRARFGARSDVLGQAIQLNNAPFTVVGVLPPGFRFPIDEVEVFLPFWTTTTATARDSHNYLAVARVAPGVTVEQASAEVAAIASTLEQAYPVNRGRGARVQPLKDVVVGDTGSLLRLLAAMVGALLLVAAANVAGLQLGDTASRHREIAVRAALGAGRLRIARQLLFESAARAGAGAVLGLFAAKAAIAFLVANAPAGVYGIGNARLSSRVIVISALVALAAGFAAGLPAALRWAAAGGLARSGSGGRTTGDAATSRLRSALVVGQVALAAILLVAAGLTTRSFARLTAVDAGFDASNLLTMEYRLPRNKYESADGRAAFHRQVLERVGAVPGVVDAAAVRALPFSGNGSTFSYSLAAGGEPRQALMNAVSSRYFQAMRIPLVAGRMFHSTEGDAPVVVISRALAEREWPGANPIGRRLFFDEVGIVATVIGVVGDVRHRELARADSGTVYTHQDQNPSLFNTLVVRASGRPMALADAVRRAVWAVDPDQPVWKIRTLESLVDQSTAMRRFLAQLAAFFGLSVAALALLGLYGVVAAAVAQRTREIGVRVALGAPRDRVLALVLWTGVRPGIAGLVVGLAGASVAAQVLRSVLFGIGPRDPLTFAGVAGLMLSAIVAACWVPARRALGVDPVNALRQE